MTCMDMCEAVDSVPSAVSCVCARCWYPATRVTAAPTSATAPTTRASRRASRSSQGEQQNAPSWSHRLPVSRTLTPLQMTGEVELTRSLDCRLEQALQLGCDQQPCAGHELRPAGALPHFGRGAEGRRGRAVQLLHSAQVRRHRFIISNSSPP